MASLRSVRFLAVGILAVFASTAAADEKKTNSLTEKEIADGWILLFDGESTFGWTGKAEVEDGRMIIPNNQSIRYSVVLPAGSIYQSPGFSGTVDLKSPKDGSDVTAERVGSASGMLISINSTFVLSIKGHETDSVFSKLKFKPAKPDPLFNGKDLEGWKVFKDEKRAKSTWDVTAGGELALKNGPGDLQTEKQFDNFLLQLECKTNGTALNSGVFFRCIADQYQNGYEMQIQNAYKDGDRTKPADFGTGAIYRRIPARKVVSNDKEWFSMTLLAHGPNIATWVNGYPVVSWKDERAPNDNPRQGLRTAKGHLSIQGHDPTTDLLFRNIRIAEVK
jgi:hypothetical protein